MNKIALLISAFTLAVPAQLAFPAAAAAQGRAGVTDFCKADVPLNPPAVLGDCVGFVNTAINGSEGLVRFICDYLSVFQPALFDASYNSLQECIVDRASELPPPPY